MQATETIPEGYKRNAMGHLIPVEQIDEVDLLRDDFVTKSSIAAENVALDLAGFKGRFISDMGAFLDLSSEEYGVTLGGAKGNITLTSFDGRYRIIRETAARIEFDERLQAAKVLVDQCLREWTKFADPNIRALIEDAFQVDKRGQINTQRILGLRKLKIEHPVWERAMQAINDAITVTGTATYYRFYKRGDDGKYRQVGLDFSGMSPLDFSGV